MQGLGDSGVGLYVFEDSLPIHSDHHKCDSSNVTVIHICRLYIIHFADQ